jgi:hypothetical protein
MRCFIEAGRLRAILLKTVPGYPVPSGGGWEPPSLPSSLPAERPPKQKQRDCGRCFVSVLPFPPFTEAFLNLLECMALDGRERQMTLDDGRGGGVGGSAEVEKIIGLTNPNRVFCRASSIEHPEHPGAPPLNIVRCSGAWLSSSPRCKQ